jgi:hypothetical protein
MLMDLSMHFVRTELLTVGLLAVLALIAAAAPAAVTHDRQNETITMSDPKGDLVLRLNYSGKCLLDQVLVRGREVVLATTGVCSGIRVDGAWYTTRDCKTAKVTVNGSVVTVKGIMIRGGGIALEETWTFRTQSDGIAWRIVRKYITGGTLDDTYFPGWDFDDRAWTGALLGTGGVAWFKLFDTPLATYGVHTGPVTFWNADSRDCLRILPRTRAGQHIAVRFSRNPHGVLSFNYSLTDQELATKHAKWRYLRDAQDVWCPFKVTSGKTEVEYVLSALDYDQAYDRGTFKGLDGSAIRELCNTIARLGVIDARFMGSNGWPSGGVALHEHWVAQLGLAIDDPYYVRSYAEALDYQRDHGLGPDGRVKSRWCWGPGDDMPGTYDELGFYECQWGWLMDSQPSYVTNVAEQFDMSGDREWVRRHKLTCEKALDYLLRRDTNGNGLVEMMNDSHAEQKSSDWIDIVWAAFENGLVNAEMYNALLLWADVEDVLGDAAMASKYRDCARQIKDSFNRSTSDGGLWDPEHQCYAYWRDKDGSVHGTCLVTPVNFMAIAYGICDDPARRVAVLDGIEQQMRKEGLFFWPLNMFPYGPEEGGGGPFPTYENGDIFLGWGEVGVRSYAGTDPTIALGIIKNVIEKYKQDSLAHQRYLRKSQTGEGSDILANMASPIVGLYRDIYGIQPKWNRLYLAPHLMPELNGTQLKYWLRDQQYVIDLKIDDYGIAANRFSVHCTSPFAVDVKGDGLAYSAGDREMPSMTITRSDNVAVEVGIEEWSAGTGARRWTISWGKDGITLRHIVSDLPPNTRWQLYRNGVPDPGGPLKSDEHGKVFIDEHGGPPPRFRERTAPPPPVTLELRPDTSR